jgi:hypothetical protein
MFPNQFARLPGATRPLPFPKNPLEFLRCRRRKSFEWSLEVQMELYGFGTFILPSRFRRCTCRLGWTTVAPTWN